MLAYVDCRTNPIPTITAEKHPRLGTSVKPAVGINGERDDIQVGEIGIGADRPVLPAVAALVQPIAATYGKKFRAIKEIRKTVNLYNSELIEQDKLKAIINPLRSQQKAIETQVHTLAGSDDYKGINDELIQNAIDNFTIDVQTAGPETKKRATRALFDSVIIHPKDKESGDRLLEVKGVCLPLTRDFLVTLRDSNKTSNYLILNKI